MRALLLGALALATACATAAPPTTTQPTPAPTVTTSAPASLPPDEQCEWHAGKCQWWHPCGTGPVGEGTCWDDCRPGACATKAADAGAR